MSGNPNRDDPLDLGRSPRGDMNSRAQFTSQVDLRNPSVQPEPHFQWLASERRWFVPGESPANINMFGAPGQNLPANPYVSSGAGNPYGSSGPAYASPYVSSGPTLGQMIPQQLPRQPGQPQESNQSPAGFNRPTGSSIVAYAPSNPSFDPRLQDSEYRPPQRQHVMAQSPTPQNNTAPASSTPSIPLTPTAQYGPVQRNPDGSLIKPKPWSDFLSSHPALLRTPQYMETLQRLGEGIYSETPLDFIHALLCFIRETDAATRSEQFFTLVGSQLSPAWVAFLGEDVSWMGTEDWVKMLTDIGSGKGVGGWFDRHNQAVKARQAQQQVSQGPIQCQQTPHLQQPRSQGKASQARPRPPQATGSQGQSPQQPPAPPHQPASQAQASKAGLRSSQPMESQSPTQQAPLPPIQRPAPASQSQTPQRPAPPPQRPTSHNPPPPTKQKRARSKIPRLPACDACLAAKTGRTCGQKRPCGRCVKKEIACESSRRRGKGRDDRGTGAGTAGVGEWMVTDSQAQGGEGEKGQAGQKEEGDEDGNEGDGTEGMINDEEDPMAIDHESKKDDHKDPFDIKFSPINEYDYRAMSATPDAEIDALERLFAQDPGYQGPEAGQPVLVECSGPDYSEGIPEHTRYSFPLPRGDEDEDEVVQVRRLRSPLR